MKFVVISDTHGHHRKLKLPKGDIIIHAGDITDHGHKKEVLDFLDWFSELDYLYKIFIGGNHDFYLDEQAVELLALIPSTITYLNNNGIEIEDIKLWGSPVTPALPDWAFGKERSEMAAHWKHLPNEIDILITHTPPRGVLDLSSALMQLGCQDLLIKVQEIKPKYHIFGHVHAGYGMIKKDGVTFINAANYNSRQGLVNPPVVFEI